MDPLEAERAGWWDHMEVCHTPPLPPVASTPGVPERGVRVLAVCAIFEPAGGDTSRVGFR